MNLNAGKPYRARLGLVGLLGITAAAVAGKAAAGYDQQAATATIMPSVATRSAQPTSSGSPAPDSAAATAAPDDATPAPESTVPAAATAGSGSSRSPGVRTVVGDAQDTQYGSVQVELVITGTTITNVLTLQIPDREMRDVEINDQAVPILRQEVLAAQSAEIDAVSGASYTSSGYAWSVQSAIDKAGLTP
jgi:uncharacterized protein with FMN-binding domain